MKFLGKFPTFDIFHTTEEMVSSFVDKQKRAVYKLMCLHGFTLEIVHFRFGYAPCRAAGARRPFGRICVLYLKGLKNLLQVGTEAREEKTRLEFGLNCFNPVDRGSMFL